MSYRPTDTSEKGLEALIVMALTGRTSSGTLAAGEVRKPSTPYGGYLVGNSNRFESRLR